jgi:hypothetical protein
MQQNIVIMITLHKVYLVSNPSALIDLSILVIQTYKQAKNGFPV